MKYYPEPPRIEVIGSGIDGVDGYLNMPYYKNEKSDANILYLCGWKISNPDDCGFIYEIKHERPDKTSYSQRTRLPPKEGTKWHSLICRYRYVIAFFSC